MNKQKDSTQEAVVQLDDAPFVFWLMNNWKYLLWILAIALALITLLYRISSTRFQQNEINYIKAENSFFQFTQSKEPDAAKIAFDELQMYIHQHPELHSKYDGLIAQQLMLQGKNEQSKDFALLAIERTKKENEPFYTNYSETTLLINQGQFQQALENAQILNIKMLKEASSTNRSFGDNLFAANLLRIAILQQELKLYDEERETWKMWKNYLQGKNPEFSSTSFEQIASILKIGNVTLLEYIQDRITK